MSNGLKALSRSISVVETFHPQNDLVLLSGPVAALELEGCEKMLLCDQSQVLGVIGEKR